MGKKEKSGNEIPYRSRFEIERKLKQIAFAYKELSRFEGKVFVHNGIDLDTGCYPFEIRFITFITFCRSIFQYAHKEIGNNSKKQKLFDAFMANNKIIQTFKRLRDSEIHSYCLGHHTIISGYSPFLPQGQSESTNPREATIHQAVTLRIAITPEFIEELSEAGNIELATAALNGEELFREIEFEGDSNIFTLCEKYYEAVKSFVAYGIENEIIT